MAIWNRQKRRIELVRRPAIRAAHPEIGPEPGPRLGHFLVRGAELSAFRLEPGVCLIGKRERFLQGERLRLRRCGEDRYYAYGQAEAKKARAARFLHAITPL